MKITKKTSVAGQFARKGEDIKGGDLVKILNEGDIVTGEWGEQHVFKVLTKNGERNCRFNQTTLNTLFDAFGEDTADWKGKDVQVWLIKAMVSGKLQTVLYLAPAGWDMNDDGRFYNPNAVEELEEEEEGELPAD